MIAPPDDQELLRCRRLIEEKMGWGSPDSWSTQDFEQLSERIGEHTGVSLSVTTLKRVWGRVKYNSAPTTTTLNALSAFVGYESWREFKNTTLIKESAVAQQAVVEPPRPVEVRLVNPSPLKRWWPALALAVGFLSLWVFFVNYSSPKPLSSSAFSFSSQSVTKGIPNSVVFHYDATASPTDSVFIQQSWDPKRWQLVPKTGHEHTSIYYFPGYYRAKLIVGQKAVREHDIIIPSDGWLAAVSQNPVPVYFDTKEVISNGVLSLPAKTIEQHNIQMQPQPPVVNYEYVRPLNGLRSDNFVFDTRVKNEYKQGSAVCQNAQITVLCRDDMFTFPLCAKGCVGSLSVYLAGYSANSKYTDLSAFGADMSQWVDVRLEVRNKHMRLLINGKQALSATFPHSPTQVLGVWYEFVGSGAVDHCRFTHTNGEIVFKDEFNSLEVSQ